MKIFLSFILCSCTIILAKAQQPDFQWTKQFDNGWGSKAIAVDYEGAVYTAGIFYGTVDCDPGPGVFSLSAPNNQWGGLGSSMCVSKLDRDGNFLWAKSFGGSTDFDNISAMAVDAHGNIYMTGIFYDTVDFDPGPSIYNLICVNSADIFVLKLDKDGNFIWAKNTCREMYEALSSGIKVDNIGNVYTTGSFYTSADFDPDPNNVFTLNTGGYANPFVSKLDPDGNFLWAKVFLAGQYNTGNSIDVDPNGNVYSTGSFSRVCDFDPGSGVFNITPVPQFGTGSDNQYDAYVSKLDPDGNFLWAKSFGGDRDDFGQCIRVDSSGNSFTIGTFMGTADFDPDPNTVFNLTATGYKDVYIVKLNSLGNFVWSKQIGGAVTEANSLAIDMLFNIYITGRFSNTVDFDPGPGSYNLTATTGYDIYISKLDSAGLFQWAKNMGETDSPFGNDDSGQDVFIDSALNVYASGWFDGTVDFDPGTGSFPLTSTGPSFSQMNGYLLKWSQCTAPASAINTTPVPDMTVCYGSNATLTATGTGTLSWYTASAGGTYLGSGNTFITAPLTAPAVFYVQDSTCTSSAVRTAVAIGIKFPTNEILSNTACGSYTLNAQAYTTSGTYTQTLTNAAGCDSIITLNLVILDPVVYSQSSTICAGQSVQVGMHIYNASGNYTDILTAANGCDSTVLTQLTVNNSIDTSVSISSTSIKANTTNASYQWIDCNNGNHIIGAATGQTFTPAANGAYAVILTEGNCVDTSSCINFSKVVDGISLYPNPTTGIFSLAVAGIIRVTGISVYNSIGQLVYNRPIEATISPIDLSALARGIYFVRIVNSDQTFVVKKVVKQ